MLYYIFNEFSMLGIYIFSHHLFGSRLKKKKKRLHFVFTKQLVFWNKHLIFS